MDTVLAILAERRAIHGDFTDDAALAQGLKDLMQGSRNWRAMTPVMREALERVQTEDRADLLRRLQPPPTTGAISRAIPGLVEERL